MKAIESQVLLKKAKYTDEPYVRHFSFTAIPYTSNTFTTTFFTNDESVEIHLQNYGGIVFMVLVLPSAATIRSSTAMWFRSVIPSQLRPSRIKQAIFAGYHFTTTERNMVAYVQTDGNLQIQQGNASTFTAGWITGTQAQVNFAFQKP